MSGLSDVSRVGQPLVNGLSGWSVHAQCQQGIWDTLDATATQQLVPRALDASHKLCLSRNMSPFVLGFKQEHPPAFKDMLSHLICMTSCKAASVKMNWDYALPGHYLCTERATEPQSPSPLPFFFRATCPSQKIVTGFEHPRGRIFLNYLYEANNTGLISLPISPSPGPSRPPARVHRPVAVKSYNTVLLGFSGNVIAVLYFYKFRQKPSYYCE